MTISKRTRERAIWILDVCMSNGMFTWEAGTGAAQVLAAAAYKEALRLRDIEDGYCYAEGAAVLRGGWEPSREELEEVRNGQLLSSRP